MTLKLIGEMSNNYFSEYHRITKEFYHNAINCANQFDAEHSNDFFVTTCPLFPYLWCSIVSAIYYISSGFLLLSKNKLKSNSNKVIFT